MKLTNRVLLAAGFLALIIISWVVVLNAKPDAEKQAELIAQAAEYMDDDIYVLAVPLLEEAAGYDAAHTSEAEEALKEAYLKLIDKRGYRRKYTELLERQMSRKDAPAEVYLEAANYYIDNSKYSEAYEILKDGIAKTKNNDLVTLYEKNRYTYSLGFDVYDDVTAIFGSTIGVQINGLWGLANSEGILIIPCEYDKISTYSVDRAVVGKDGAVFAVNRSNMRLALLKPKEDQKVSDFGNLAQDRLPVLIGGKWYRATGELVLGSAGFDWIGMYADGNAAAMQDGQWGVIDRAADWTVPAEYDGIIMDELGRSYGQSAVFARKGGSVYLLVGGVQTGGPYEDAKPFGSTGYAAVKQGGKWGFVDTSGEFMIGPQFDDALSFGQHLAAVRQGEFWGYINLHGDIVIEPVFQHAKSFENGSAPVLTERGWQFITLLEYKKGASL